MIQNCKECNKEFHTSPNFVRRGDGIYCSRKCYGQASALKLSGMKFNRLLVGEIVGINIKGERLWRCQCDCGNTHIVPASALKNGRIQSCGCFKREKARAQCNEKGSGYKHGGKNRNSPYHHLYSVWVGHLNFILNIKHKSHKYYMGMPIEPRWDKRKVADKAYPNFQEDVLSSIGDRPTSKHTLDIVNHSKGFVNGNIRWATRTEQINNRRYFFTASASELLSRVSNQELLDEIQRRRIA